MAMVCFTLPWLWYASLFHGIMIRFVTEPYLSMTPRDDDVLLHDFTIRLVTEFDSTTRFNAIE